MSDNVAEFPGVSRHPSPVPKILAAASGQKLQSVVVVGMRENGTLYFASSDSDGKEVLWLMELAKWELMEVALK
jgi:hypothetical protein